MTALTYNGAAIRAVSDRLNLTDMWRAAGSPENREPYNWARKEGAAFVEAVAISQNLPVGQVYHVRPGRNGGTEGHWQIGLAYAKYLSPEFHMWCNTVVRERMEGRAAVAQIDMAAIGGMVKAILIKTLDERVPAMIEERLATDPRIAVGEFVPALAVLIEHKVPARRRRGFAVKVSHRLRGWCAERGIACRKDAWRGTWVFPVAAVADWLDAEGRALIADHVDRVRGQGVIQFPRAEKSGGAA